jgi:hypothetical protein
MRFLILLILSSIAACGGAADDTIYPEADGTTSLPEDGPQSRLVVFQKLGVAKLVEEGMAPGFNIDALVSEAGDAEGCGHADLTAPDGTPGIDNQLAGLVPLLELAGLGAFESLLQSTIEDGGILIMLQIDGVDDFLNDDEVSVMVRAGHGVPLLGTDGLVLSGQTFSLNEESPDSLAENARIEDGVLHAGPFEARLPLVVFGMKYEITFHNTQIRAEITDDGGLVNGLMGGGVALEDLYAIGEIAAADDASVLAGIKLVVGGAGDLAPNEAGECQQISGTFEFAAVSAYFFSEDD